MAVSGKKHLAVSDEASTVGILGLMGRFARQLPGAEFAEEQLHNIESRALRELKERLASVDERRLPAPEQHISTAAMPSGKSSQHPAVLLADLLGEAVDQTDEQARLCIYSKILRELVPDEARLLGALSDGDAYPLLHIGLGAPIGTPRRVAENISNLGKTASLKLKEFTPEYIAHMRNLGLLEEGPEDKQLDIKYQILESEKSVREFAQQAEKGTVPGMGVRYIRRVIRIAPLGKALWDACQPRQDTE